MCGVGIVIHGAMEDATLNAAAEEAKPEKQRKRRPHARRSRISRQAAEAEQANPKADEACISACNLSFA